MKYYLGIDGGGTKTKVIVINENHEIIFENTAGPSSIDTVDLETTYQHILLAIKSFFAEQKIVFHGIFVGLGGVVFDADKDIVAEKFRHLPGVFEDTKISVQNDMHNALHSGLLFEEGMCLICGTGMVAFGKNKTIAHKAGGWGYKEGELGSGYHLGIEGIRYMIRCFDERLPKDDFALEIAKAVDLKDPRDIIAIMDDLHQKRTVVASLAPIVTAHANSGHPYALKIVEYATDELALAVKSVYQKLDLKNPQIVIVGSLGNTDGIFKTKLQQKIKAINAKINILAPIIDPALAAAISATNL